MINQKIFTRLLTGVTSMVLLQAIALSNPSQNSSWQKIAALMGLGLPAIANEAQSLETDLHYNPPDRGAPQSTRGTGSRGCDQSIPVSLNLLVPSDHVGYTATGRPTFSWYVSDPVDVPMEFTLVERGVAEPIFVQQMQVKTSKFVHLQMPENLPELLPGRQYRWSVTLICNPARRSEDIFAQAWIEPMPMAAELLNQLATIEVPRDRARFYAREGFWYDALTEIAKAHENNPNDRAIAIDMISLLEQGGLNQIANEERQRLALGVEQQ